MHALRLAALALLIASACGEDEPAGPPAVSVTASPTRFASGLSTTLTISVENFELRAPFTTHSDLRLAHGGDLHEGVPALAADGGHYHIYLDRTDVNPLRMGWQPTIEVTVTASTGPHQLIVRLNADDHRFLNPEVLDIVDIELE